MRYGTRGFNDSWKVEHLAIMRAFLGFGFDSDNGTHALVWRRLGYGGYFGMGGFGYFSFSILYRQIDNRGQYLPAALNGSCSKPVLTFHEARSVL